MADFGAPASSNYNAPDGLGTLNKLMSLRQSQQGLQQQQLEMQGQGSRNTELAAGAQSAQLAQGEQMAVRNLMTSGQTPEGQSILGDDGEPDPQKALKILPKIAPTTWTKYAEGIQDTASKKLALKSSTADLSQKYRDQVGSILQSGINDPQFNSQKAASLLAPYGQQNPDAAPAVTAALGLLKHLDNAPDQQTKNNMLVHTIQAFRPSAANQPGSVQTGAATVPTSVQPFTGAQTLSGAPIANQIGPSVAQLPTGQLGKVAPGGASVSPIPSAGAQGPLGANPTAPQMAAATGQAQAITGRVAQAQEQANSTVQTQDALNRASHILESGSAANAGASFDTRKYLKNFLAGVGIDTQGADDTNSLVKNLARYEASRATAAGLGHTDAARELAHTGSPNTAIDNKALLGIVKQSLATEKALAAYGNAQAKTNDPAEWSKNEAKFRSIPNLIQGYEYGLSKSPQEADQFLAKHGLSREDMKTTRTQIKAFEAQ